MSVETAFTVIGFAIMAFPVLAMVSEFIDDPEEHLPELGVFTLILIALALGARFA